MIQILDQAPGIQLGQKIHKLLLLSNHTLFALTFFKIVWVSYPFICHSQHHRHEHCRNDGLILLTPCSQGRDDTINVKVAGKQFATAVKASMSASLTQEKEMVKTLEERLQKCREETCPEHQALQTEQALQVTLSGRIAAAAEDVATAASARGSGPDFFSLLEKIQEIAEKGGVTASNKLAKVVDSSCTYIVKHGGMPKSCPLKLVWVTHKNKVKTNASS